MTTQDRVKRTIYGELTDLATKIGTKGEYSEVKLQVEGQRYPLTCRAFDEALVKQFKQARKGMTVGLEVEEEKGEYTDKDGKKRSVTYRNIVGIVAARESAPQPPPGTGPAAPAPADARPSEGQTKSDSDLYWEERNRTIEAEWAINQAREMMQWEEADAPSDGRFLELETLVANAQWFLDAKLMLTNARRSGVRIGDAPAPTPGPAKAPAGQRKAAAKPPAATSASGGTFEEHLQAVYDKAHADFGMDVVDVNTIAKEEGVDLSHTSTDLIEFWRMLKAEAAK